MTTFKAGGVEWYKQSQSLFRGEYCGHECELDRYTGRQWKGGVLIRNTSGGGRWVSTFPHRYDTRREVIESIKCLVLFLSGGTVFGVGAKLFGNVEGDVDTERVEDHLRNWL